jgi:hypothetical protein
MAEEQLRHPEEETYRQLAVAMGEPLEAVWGMREEERAQLVKLLLGGGESAALESLVETPVVAKDEQETAAAVSPDSGLTQAWLSPEESFLRGEEALLELEEETGKTGIQVNNREVATAVEARLLADTATVKRMLVGTRNEHMDNEIVTAYLQAHLYDPRRVQVVVEELGDVEPMEDSPELVREPSLEQPKEKGKGGGGKGRRRQEPDRGAKRTLAEAVYSLLQVTLNLTALPTLSCTRPGRARPP